MKQYSTHFFLILFVFIVCGAAWQPVTVTTGLPAEHIHLISGGDKGFIIGNSSGLHFVDAQNGMKESLADLPVLDMTHVEEKLYVALSDGSKSDAILSGEKILDGSPYYFFKNEFYLHKPRAIAANSSSLFICSDTAAYMATITEADTLGDPRVLFMPENAFSKESPRCYNAICFNTYDFLVGGAGTTSSETESSVLFLNNDSLYKKYDFPTYTLGELRLGTFWTPTLFLGSDSLLYIKGPDHDTAIVTPDKMKVISFIALPHFWGNSETEGVPVIGTESGAYTLDVASMTFTKMGGLTNPIHTFYYNTNDSTLYAGTDKGVYSLYFNDSTNLITQSKSVSSTPKAYMHDGEIQLHLTDNSSGPCVLSLYSISGRLLTCRELYVSKGMIRYVLDDNLLSENVYLLSCHYDKRDITTVLINLNYKSYSKKEIN